LPPHIISPTCSTGCSEKRFAARFSDTSTRNTNHRPNQSLLSRNLPPSFWTATSSLAVQTAHYERQFLRTLSIGLRRKLDESGTGSHCLRPLQARQSSLGRRAPPKPS